jgi:hypothetical protein
VKRETLRHPKTYDLAARLKTDRPAVLGRLQLLWDYTGEVATRGDIGKWPNAVIAAACEWTGAPDEFVQALVDSRWLDEHSTYRLVVHDWPDHCEKWVKLKLKRSKTSFLPCYTLHPDADSEEDADASRTSGQCTDTVSTPSPQGSPSVPTPSGQCPDVFTPFQTKPNQTEPNPSHGFGSVCAGATPKALPVDWSEACRMASTLCKELGQLPDGPNIAVAPGGARCLKAETPQDRAFILRLCVRIQQGVIPAKWLTEAASSTLKAAPREPWTYLTRCIENMAQKAKPRVDLTKTLEAIPVPEQFLQPRPP